MPTPHVVDQLVAYREAGFETLVVDTSPTLVAERRSDWERNATDWVQRPNEGYDFTSYKVGVERLQSHFSPDLSSLWIVLTNDSCFGPFGSLEPLIRFCESVPDRPPAVIGITDSQEIAFHIQSYWLCFRPDVVPLVIEFLQTLGRIESRQEAIHAGELGISRFMKSRGCVVRVMYPVADVVRRFATFRGAWLSFLELGFRRVVGRPRYSRKADGVCMRYLRRRPDALVCNTTIEFGVAMFRERMNPFVKRQLLRDNPYDDPAIPDGLNFPTLQNDDVRQLLTSKSSAWWQQRR